MKHNIIRAFTATALFVAAPFSAASAADMPLKAPPAPPPPVSNWTGFYAGVNGGYGWSRTEVDPVGSILFCNPGVGGCVGNAAPLSQIGSIPASLVTNPKGGEFGGQVGYNYQFSSWVAGVEADLSWTNFKGSSTAFGFAPVTGFPADFRATTATASEQLRYFGTVRGRFGYLVTNPLLAYVTGGLAYGNVQSSTALTQVAGGPGCAGCLVTPGNGSVSTTRAGWTVGGGLEYLLPGSWTVRAEYLYYDLGRTSYGLTPLALSQGGPPFSIVGVTSNTSDFRGSIARVGLNRLFN